MNIDDIDKLIQRLSDDNDKCSDDLIKLGFKLAKSEEQRLLLSTLNKNQQREIISLKQIIFDRQSLVKSCDGCFWKKVNSGVFCSYEHDCSRFNQLEDKYLPFKEGE